MLLQHPQGRLLFVAQSLQRSQLRFENAQVNQILLAQLDQAALLGFEVVNLPSELIHLDTQIAVAADEMFLKVRDENRRIPNRT